MPAPARLRALTFALAAGLLAACTSGVGGRPPGPAPATPSAPTGIAATSTPETSTRATPHLTRIRISRPASARPAPRTTSSHPTTPPRPTPTRTRPEQLPLGYPTVAARQVITVVAGSRSDTEGTLRAWRRVEGGWRPVGPSVHAWLGSAGMSDSPSESSSAAPMGSYPLTQAFGHDSDPGTTLPYRQTAPADWWISQPGDLYNTLQHCASDCPFTQGVPNEHLYYETPYYDYAVVIDYNRNPVRQGAGSAFFLHVSVGAPTQGCVAIDRDQLVRIMRWLRPNANPRILIGTV
ncbi:MAG: L,D-transpeptidase family protein [Jatrophihabitantaceae bacterium]